MKYKMMFVENEKMKDEVVEPGVQASQEQLTSWKWNDASVQKLPANEIIHEQAYLSPSVVQAYFQSSGLP